MKIIIDKLEHTLRMSQKTPEDGQ